MIIGALVSEERSYFRPTQQDSVRAPRAIGPQTGIDYIPTPAQNEPFAYRLSLTDQQEPSSNSIHVEGSYSYLRKNGKRRVRTSLKASPWDMLDGISQTIFSPSCSHRIDSLAGSLGEGFVLHRPDGDIQNYAVGDQCLLVNHHGHPFHQLLPLAAAVECCILHQDGCLSCAMELAKRLDIKIVVC